MFKKEHLLLWAIVALLLPLVSLNAQIYSCLDDGMGNPVNPLGGACNNAIVTAVPFLRIVPGARSGAMGDAGIALSPDANALHFNASKLVFAKEETGIEITYTPWLRALNVPDVYLAYLSAYSQLDEDQAIGFGLRYFSLGDIAFTDENGTPLGNGRPNEFELNFTYARKLSKQFSAGIGAKYIYSNLANGQEVGGEQISAGTGFATDISFTYQTPLALANKTSQLRAGLALTNLGSKITYTNSIEADWIPSNFGLGIAWEIDLDAYNQLTFTTELNKLMVPTRNPLDGGDYRTKGTVAGILGSFGDAPDGFSEELRELMWSFGMEYWYDQQFALRMGYFHEHATKGNRKYFTAGLGIKYQVFGINISYLIPTTNQRSPLDNTLRFSLLFDLGGDTES